MIDWSRASELRDEIGAEDFAEVVEIFLEEMEEEITVLKGGIANKHLEGKLHFLKGSALNLGFEDFARLCQSGESAASKGQFDQMDLPQLINTYETSKSEFLSNLESRFAA